MSENMNIVILGAGLTGLSAAYHGGGTIYEKEKEVGGTCRSPKIKGYTFDLGIHVLHTKNDYVLNLLIKNLNAPLLVQRRRAWIYSYNTLTRYPFQANTYGLPIKVVKDCLLGFIDVYNKDSINYDNYEDWIYATFGKGIAEHFLIPYSEKFWTIPPKEMTADWPDSRIPRPELEEVLEGALSDQKKGFGPNWTFRYPKKNGICTIPDAFYSINSEIFLNKEAIGVDIQKKEITFSDGFKKRYDKLISTTPLPELVKIIHDLPGEVVNASQGLRYNSIFCVNLGIKNPNLNDAHWIYYPQGDYSFFRISFPKNFLENSVPEGKSSITSEISYSQFKELDKGTIVDRVIKDLIKAKVLKRNDKIELIDTRDIKYGYIIYDHNRSKNSSIIKKFLMDNNIYTAGRYGSWEYYWMDDSILDGKRAIDHIKEQNRIKG
ncbi:MAG: FAD-dependent oxidoreductase [Thermodesulfobacteriota bacterium]